MEGKGHVHYIQSFAELGEDSLPVPTTELIHVHDEFLQFVRDSGIESIAKESGVLSQDGEITILKDYISNSALPQFHDYQTTSSSKSERDGDDSSDGQSNGKKRRKTTKSVGNEKVNKGLRHFSLKVCQNVERKKQTTYNEVADELVAEFNSSDKFKSPVDQKNIRRRVYDALNVLMAMGIITKEKKEIKWIGLPANAKQELEQLESEKQTRLEALKKKRASHNELRVPQTGYRSLIERNSKPEAATDSKIELPFIIVNTKNTTVIECEVADDRSAYFFNFSLPFEIHDDSEILKRMGLM